jgi:hypothetical protein
VPGQVFGCPDEFFESVTVTFRAQAGGPVLAQAGESPYGCGLFSYSMPGRATLGIGGYGAESDVATEIDRLTGLHWEAGLEGGATMG